MESHVFNPTFLKSRNTIWRTISSRGHALPSSPVIEKTQPQTDVISVDPDEEVSTQALTTTTHAPTNQLSNLALATTFQQLHLELPSESNIGNEITILNPQGEEHTTKREHEQFN